MNTDATLLLLQLLSQELGSKPPRLTPPPAAQLNVDPDDLLTCAKAAKFLGMGRASWWRLRRECNDPLLAPREPKPGMLRYSRLALAAYRDKTARKAGVGKSN